MLVSQVQSAWTLIPPSFTISLYVHDICLSPPPPPPTRQLQAQSRRQTELKKAISILQEANTTRSQEVWSASDGGTKKKPTIANDSGTFAILSSVDRASLTSTERPALPPPQDAKHELSALNALEGEGMEGQPEGTDDSGTATTPKCSSADTDGIVDTAVARSSNSELVLAEAAEGATLGPAVVSAENDRDLSGLNMKDVSPCSQRPATEAPMMSLIYLINENESMSDIDLQSSLGSSESVSSKS